ncbi:MAG: fibronectin type III domain-containing protein [Steroidobacterales bacterium]|jgi:hypothetical protein
MTTAQRGRGARRGIYICAAAALGIALCGCGGNSGTSSVAASAADGSAATGTSAPTQGSTPGTSPSAGSGTAAGSSASGPSSGSTGSGSTSSGSSGSGTSGRHSSGASDGNVTLNWLPPTENTDGTALTNLAGYDIHYGKSSHRYTQKIRVSNGGIATYVVQDLPKGRYYFSVAALNSHGTESPLSAEVIATVN